MPTADEDRISERKARAIKLRVSGKSIREIAKELEISVGQAHADVRESMAGIAAEARKHSETEVALDLERMDRALDIVLGVLEKGVNASLGDEDEDLFDSLSAQQELKLKAVDRLVKLAERRSKLLGLDAPEKRQIETTVGIASPAEAARLVRESFTSRAIDKPLDGTSSTEELPTGDAGSGSSGAVPTGS